MCRPLLYFMIGAPQRLASERTPAHFVRSSPFPVSCVLFPASCFLRPADAELVTFPDAPAPFRHSSDASPVRVLSITRAVDPLQKHL